VPPGISRNFQFGALISTAIPNGLSSQGFSQVPDAVLKTIDIVGKARRE